MRRQLQRSWDLAFAWVRDEGPIHHLSTPWQILLAMVSLSITWGWIDVAGLMRLGFGALLRTGEMTGALRKDLLLPADTLHTNDFALLSLQEPKTRCVAARHQRAKLDIEDLLAVVVVAFQHLQPHQRLWGIFCADISWQTSTASPCFIKTRGRNLDLAKNGRLRTGSKKGTLDK